MTRAVLKSINIESTDNLFCGAFKLLLAGFGFLPIQRPPGMGYYEVYSHGGDYIGRIPEYMVGALIAHMRRQYGIEYHSMKNYYMRPDHTYQHTITYGWQNLISVEDSERLQMQFFHKPLEIR